MASAPGGLTPGAVWEGFVLIMGSGGLAAVLLALLGALQERRAAGRAAAPPPAPAGPPVLPPEARAAIGCGLADRLSIERIEHIDELVGDLTRAVERLFAATGRQHGETSEQVRALAEQIRALADRVDLGIDEARRTRHAMEDGIRQIRDRLARD